jgi:hypothetical protein
MAISDDFKKEYPKITSAIEFAADAMPYVKGAMAAYETGTSILTELGILDAPANVNPFDLLYDKLNNIQRAIDAVYTTLQTTETEVRRLTNYIIRTKITDPASDIHTARIDAWNYLKDPSDDLKDQLIETRGNARIKINYYKDPLVEETYWTIIYLGDVGPIKGDPYPGAYSDVWSGPLFPKLEYGEEVVWDYRLALPVYLNAILDWSICILASDKSFKDAQQVGMIDHITKLQSVLMKILNGYKLIQPPTIDEMKWVVPAMNDSNFYYKTGFGNKQLLTPEQRDKVLNNLAFFRVQGWVGDSLGRSVGRWRLSEYIYGVVETYTGNACVDHYPQDEINDGAKYISLDADNLNWHPEEYYPASYTAPNISNPELFQKFYDHFILRHTLRSWKQGRKLSLELGLLNLRNFIRQLCAGLNMPETLPQDALKKWNRYVVLSVREVFWIVPESIRLESTGGVPFLFVQISLRHLAKMLGTTPFSVRRMVLDEETQGVGAGLS